VGHNQGVSSNLAPLAEAALNESIDVDPALAAAIDQAKEAAIIEAGNSEFIGEHLAVIMEADRLATHLFDCTNPAYVGWQWAVTMASTLTGKKASVTVTDVVLLPGPQALIAPAWIPWSERIQPGDLSPGDVLPASPDDHRLTAGFAEFLASDIDEDFHYVEEYRGVMSGWELGLGRARVLSVTGREEAADRWFEGEFGPDSAMARQAPGPCSTCGFHVALAGPLGQAFAVCTNALSPADGRIVSLNFGCGAHSGVTDPGFTPVERAGTTNID
jgi:Protein of unknown function (DUF3027)